MNITHPHPGETKFDTEAMDRASAHRLAHFNYDNITHVDGPYMSNGSYYDVRTASGSVACIGLINGKSAILHKDFSPTNRTLEISE